MLNSNFGDELWYLQLPHKKIVELIWILEGYEGLCVPRVLDKARGIVELLTAPDLHEVLSMVISDLDEIFPVKRVPRPDGVKSIADEEYLS